MRARPGWIAIGALALLSGCHSKTRTPVQDAGTAARVEIADAGRPAPPTLAVTLKAALADGGTETFALAAGAPPTLPLSTSLVVRTNLELPNARIRLMDGSDRLVPSDETIDVADGGLEDHIALKKPLQPSSHYHVLIDAESGQALHDAAGDALPDQRLAFETVDAPKPPPKPARRHHRHRRRRHHRSHRR